MDIFHDNSIPVGFAMALSQNLNDTDEFAEMTEAEKEEYLNKAKDSKLDDKKSDDTSAEA